MAATRTRHTLPPADESIIDHTPRQLTKQEFGRKLMGLILERGWNQSELARRAGLNRDAISTYVRGVSFPDPRNLHKLAKALDTTAEKLLPNATIMAMETDVAPMLEIRQASGHPDKVWVRVNQMVSFQQAADIFEVLKARPE